MVADYAGRFGCLSSSVMHATNYVLRIEADKLCDALHRVVIVSFRLYCMSHSFAV